MPHRVSCNSILQVHPTIRDLAPNLLITFTLLVSTIHHLKMGTFNLMEAPLHDNGMADISVCIIRDFVFFAVNISSWDVNNELFLQTRVFVCLC